MVLWQDYAPMETTRRREDIEWSTHYAYHATDFNTPRVLLIGDSICNAYQSYVREKLEGKINVTFWASSKCVTDPDYFRELDFITGLAPVDVICFNNGLHSLTTERGEWTWAYESAVRFLQAKFPGVKLLLLTSTPTRPETLAAVVRELNKTVSRVAEEKRLPLLDLYAAMDPLDRGVCWSDDYHFKPDTVEMQAELIARKVTELIGEKD